jgi:phage terminase large subunit
MLKYPRARGLIVRATLVSLGSTGLVTWREHVVPELLDAKQAWFYGGSTEEAAQYRYTNGSSVTIGGMDKPTKIMSSEYDLAYVQEAIELQPAGWEAITSRLRNGRMPYQQLLADTNPSHPAHWLKQRCDRGDCVELLSRHRDNPRLYDRNGQLTPFGVAYMRKLDRLTGARKLRLRDGLWVASEGQIFDEFDPAIHVVAPFPIPDSWPRYWVIDFGFTNPFVCQWWAEDPDGRLYMYREIYRTKRLVEEHAVAIMDQVSRLDPGYVHRGSDRRRAADGRVWTEPMPQAIICDHDAEGRATLEREVRMASRAAKKDVRDGLQVVQSRLKLAGDGRPRMYLMSGALVQVDTELLDALKPTCTVEEIPGYIWADGAKKEEPVKENDHGCDTMRYICMERDDRDGGNFRWI